MAAYSTSSVRALGARGTAMANAYRKPVAPKAPSYAKLQGLRANAMANAYKPRRVAVGGPKFTPPVVIADGGDASVDWAPSYQPGTEQYAVDPVQRAMSAALAARSRGEAQSQAASKKKQAAIEYGEGTEGEANPFSVRKVNERNYQQGLSSLEDQLNEANLFYSGYRAKALGDASQQFQQTQYDAANRYRGFLADVDAQLAQALLQADMLDPWAEGGVGMGQGGPTGWGIGVGTGQGDPRIGGISGALIATPYDPNKNSDIEYAVPGRGDDANQGGWVPDGNGWYSPVYGIRTDENGRIR